MRMDKLATANINSFGIAPQADVPPSEESIFVLTSGQLKDIITRAIQPLQEELSSLREERDQDRQEMAAMKGKIASLEELIETKREENIQEFNGIYKSLMLHRQDIDELSNPKKKTGETESARVKRIEKYLLNRPDHKATYESLRGLLGVDKDLLNDAITALMAASPGRYGISHVPGDKRKRALVMLPK